MRLFPSAIPRLLQVRMDAVLFSRESRRPPTKRARHAFRVHQFKKKKPGSYLLRSKLRATHSLRIPAHRGKAGMLPQHAIYLLPEIQAFKQKEAWQLPTFPRRAVSSAQESLTSVFGMGTGIASPPWPPGD